MWLKFWKLFIPAGSVSFLLSVTEPYILPHTNCRWLHVLIALLHGLDSILPDKAAVVRPASVNCMVTSRQRQSLSGMKNLHVNI